MTQTKINDIFVETYNVAKRITTITLNANSFITNGKHRQRRHVLVGMSRRMNNSSELDVAEQGREIVVK